MFFFNTTLGLSMLADGSFEVETISTQEAVAFLTENAVENAANPDHSNSLQALTQITGVDVTAAQGGRISLETGDICLVAQISGIPRETREFTDEEIAAARFTFRLVKVK